MADSDLFFSFRGRVPRKTYWLYCGLPLTAVGFVIEYLHAGPVLKLFIFLPILWPSLALHAKRWHDQNKSGWWQLISFIPVIGWLVAVAMCGFIKGTSGSNNYGNDPLTDIQT